MRAWPILIFAAAGLSGCAAVAPPPSNLSGQWGGPHISLLLEGGLGQIEYDCASGTVDTVIYPDKEGHFTATGTHRTGQGGPVRVGQVFISHRAVYSGTVQKEKMTFAGKLEDGTVIGPFSLTLGSKGELTRCL
jgi:hypothetical protein